jgi:hypothetical protein
MGLFPMKELSGVAFLTSLLAGAALMALAVVLTACSTSASTWQRPGTSEDVTKADIAACQSASVERGYGSWGAAYRNYVIRCMQDKGYQAGG